MEKNFKYNILKGKARYLDRKGQIQQNQNSLLSIHLKLFRPCHHVGILMHVANVKRTKYNMFM